MEAAVCFASAQSLAGAGEHGLDEAQRTLAELAIPEGMPFLLDERGEPLASANAWLRALPLRGCRSPRTWAEYARELLRWHTFLRSRGSGLIAATRDDIAAYHARLRLAEAGERVSAVTWNRTVAALDNFYDWAYEEELIEKLPFSYRQVRVSGRDGGARDTRVNHALEKGARPHASLRWLERDRLQSFLDVGINGLLPDGSPDPAYSGRQTARNRVACEVMAEAGLRVQEVSHLTVFELPVRDKANMPYLEWQLPAGVCKGLHRRTTWIPPWVAQAIASYVDGERTLSKVDWRPSSPLLVKDPDRDGARITGRKRRWDDVRPNERRRLVLEDGRSPLLFLSSTGAPILRWDRVFADAVGRCRALDPSFPHVTPHMLRHTFAVHMLRWLTVQNARFARNLTTETAPVAEVAAAWAQVSDPLLRLRDLLGHSSVTTTQVYLQGINHVRLYADIIDAEDGENG